MIRRSSPGLGEWTTVTLIVVIVVVLLYQLYRYGTVRSALPAGLMVAGIEVGGSELEEARELISQRYLETPIIVYHGENAIELDPVNDAEFKLDMETMMSEADYQRAQQDFWAGFWGFLWNRPVEVEPVELRATHSADVLQESLEVIASRLDNPSQPPQPIPSTLSFRYGEAGISTDIRASLDDVANALYRPTGREAHLTLEGVNAERPELSLLGRLIVNHFQEFEQNQGGTASIFIVDLETGGEIALNSGLPLSAMNVAKIPIVLTLFQLLDRPPTVEQRQLVEETLTDMGTTSANLLLELIAGEPNAYLGAERVTQSMQQLGLVNTFVAMPYEGTRPATVETPANTPTEADAQVEELLTNPDPGMQTTAEDIGTLLSMIYFCAEDGGGALMAAFPGEITQAECAEMLTIMKRNQIDSLIQEGVPADTPVAHQQGWISDTHGDAGIVYTPGGDYVLVEFLYKPDWLEWAVSSPLMADISRAAYNYFNFSSPFLETARSSN